MALALKFQAGKTLSVHPAQAYQRGNRLGEDQGMPEGTPGLSRGTAAHLSPRYFYALNMELFCFGLSSKIRVSENGQVRQIHPFPLMVNVPGERNQDLDLNLLGQHRREDAFL